MDMADHSFSFARTTPDHLQRQAFLRNSNPFVALRLVSSGALADRPLFMMSALPPRKQNLIKRLGRPVAVLRTTRLAQDIPTVFSGGVCTGRASVVNGAGGTTWPILSRRLAGDLGTTGPA
jgi:hypothetical protein